MSKISDTYTEKKVLGAMLNSDNTLEYAAANMTSDDFNNEDLSFLYDTIIRFYRKYHKPLARDIFNTWLSKNRPKEKVRLMLLFTEIESIPIDVYSKYYINELKNYTTTRQLYNIQGTIADGLNSGTDPDKLFTDLSRMVLTGSQTSIVYRTSVFDKVDERIRLYQDKRDYPEKYRGLPYGIAEIDELTGGMYAGQLYMIIGRTGAGKCVKFDSKILMLDGSLNTIENIVKEKDARPILTFDAQNIIVQVTPTSYMYSGKQQIYKVMTKSGRTIEVTKSHPLLSSAGWKPLQEFKEGDRLAVPRSLPVFGKSRLSTNDVKLLAYLITEGNLSTSSVGFTNYDVDIRKDFCGTVKYSSINGIAVTSHGTVLPKEKRTLTITGSVLSETKIEYGPGKFRRLNINPIKPWLAKFNLLGKKSVNKEIPNEIFKLPEANMAQFLGILWSCDGSIYGDNLNHITFETGSPILTKQVAHLLLRFGILTRYWVHRASRNDKKFVIGSLEVIGSCRKRFLEKIGPYFVGQKCSKVKQALNILKTCTLNTNVDTIPMSLIYPYLPKTAFGKINKKKMLDVGCKLEINYSKNWNVYGICRQKILSLAAALSNVELYELATSDIFWDTIQSIDKGETVDTYDLEMASTSNFIANDILVHNSRMLFNIGANVAKIGKTVMYCTIEMEAAIIQHMWESRETRTPLKSILRATLDKTQEQKYLDFIKSSADSKIPFFIIDIPQGCTTGIIDAEVATFEKVHGKVPDIVLIDYANLINPISKFKDRAEKYDHVFRELHEGARAYGTVYYTAAQMNRESLKSKEPGTEHVAFSDAASYHCDAVFRVYADKHIEENKELHFDVIKGRYHEKASISLLWMPEINFIGSYTGHVNLSQKKVQYGVSYSGSAGDVLSQQSEELKDY